jgi:hypothetical protein
MLSGAVVEDHASTPHSGDLWRGRLEIFIGDRPFCAIGSVADYTSFMTARFIP